MVSRGDVHYFKVNLGFCILSCENSCISLGHILQGKPAVATTTSSSAISSMMANLPSRGFTAPANTVQNIAKPEPAKVAVISTPTAVTQAPTAIKSALVPPVQPMNTVTKPKVVTVAQPMAVQQAPTAIKSAIITQPMVPGQ